ncbi:MAG: putative sulfate exporter family transporter [Planctomycetes bacterium]|nr:putative sulfate exporter family transporter [Planctomycetota bacterium]MCB9935868.1 putative sulfate exporter family transporter [Planctomycetota bacterium]
MTPTSTSEPAADAARTQGLLAGTLVLIVLALVAKLAHLIVPQLPGAVWALLFGILAGLGSGRIRALPELPYHLPLTVGLILLGVQLQPGLFLQIGWRGLLLVGALWLGVAVLARLAVKLGLLTPRLAGLLTLGLIGCGVTAITAAAQQDRKAAGVPAVYAMLAVLLSGAIALLLYPWLGELAGLEAGEFGALAGITIANSAEAVATAGLRGDESMGIAAGYKLLVNAVQGVPILAYLWLYTPKQQHSHGWGLPKALLQRVPYFVWGFGAVALASALGAFSAEEREQLGHLTRYAFFVALVGVGYRTRLDVLRRVGLRPVLVGLVIWAITSAGVLLVLHAWK